MNSYILKNVKGSKDVLLFKESNGYSFTPKKGYKHIKKITVLDEDMASGVLERKILKEYNKLVNLMYELVANDDNDSEDVLAIYTEIDRIREYLYGLKEKGLKKETMDKYLKKLYVLELELKKVHVIELEKDISEERGKGR